MHDAAMHCMTSLVSNPPQAVMTCVSMTDMLAEVGKTSRTKLQARINTCRKDLARHHSKRGRQQEKKSPRW